VLCGNDSRFSFGHLQLVLGWFNIAGNGHVPRSMIIEGGSAGEMEVHEIIALAVPNSRSNSICKSNANCKFCVRFCRFWTIFAKQIELNM